MKSVITILLFFISFSFFAQKKKEDLNLPKGNEAFEAKKYADAETDYRISDATFSKKAKASYNLGNAIYKQKQITEAKYHFAKAVQNAKTKQEKHQSYHNLGNCLMTEKEYGGAVEAYKNALRNNPSDEKTRYNYALAKKMLKEQPPKKNDEKNKDDKKNQKEDKKKDQDKNKDDNKERDKNEDKKDQSDKNKPDNKEGQSPQKQPSGISKDRMENMLDAVNNEEKKIQDKVNLQKVKAPKKAEKDW
jgi:tetratricopeptide (TPR) repeat protein